MKTYSPESMRNGFTGFTLIEVLISVCILAVAILGTSILQGKLIKAQIDSEQQYEASTLAQKKIEELRVFSTIALYNGISSGSDTVTGRNATYTRTWAIVTSASPAYKTATVTVSWVTNSAASESIVLSSTIAGIDPYNTGKTFSTYSPVSLP